jgi:hypothetical protein
MTLNTIAKAIRNAIRDDASLVSTCDTLFGKRHLVFYSADGTHSPTVDECPCFSIHPASKSVGVNLPSQSFAVRIAISILQGDPDIGVNDIEFSGPQNLETLCDRSLLLITGLSSNISVDGADFEIGVVNEFPVLTGELTLSISVANLIGAQLTL